MSNNQFEIYKNKGNECFKLNRIDEARKYYSKAISEKGDEPTAYSNRAMCYIKLNKFYEAKEDCDQAILLDPNFVKAYYRRATALKRLHRYQKAIDDLREVTRLDSTFKQASIEITIIEQLLKEDKRIELDTSSNDKPQHLRSKHSLRKYDLNNRFSGTLSYSPYYIDRSP